jgi:hypothetical protein
MAWALPFIGAELRYNNLLMMRHLWMVGRWQAHLPLTARESAFWSDLPILLTIIMVTP